MLLCTHCPVTAELGDAAQRRQCGVCLTPVDRPMSALVGSDSAAGCPAWEAATWWDDPAPAAPRARAAGLAHSSQWLLSGLVLPSRGS